MFSGIKNKQDIATTKKREVALDILASGLAAIDTSQAVDRNIVVDGDRLRVGDHTESLERVSRIHIIGFGKAACEGAMALEEKLGNSITSGIVIDNKEKTCQIVDAYAGDHPKPSDANVEASREVVELAESVTENDLVLVAVSGGGSSLLCWPPDECQQSQLLYDEFLDSGGTIRELNTVRKHLSKLKGGGLAKKLHPARVVGLIFSDVPGGELADVASGPTFRDDSTVADAKSILEKYDITTGFDFYESPKDRRYFDTVTNVPLVTNETALTAMVDSAHSHDLEASVLSSQLYELPEAIAKRFTENLAPGSVLLGGGEVSLQVGSNAGKGGRNQHLALEVLQSIDTSGQLFLSAASDGRDNTKAAGAIADIQTKQKAEDIGLPINEYLAGYDSFSFFDKTGDHIYTGPTGANVADLMLYLQYE